MHYTKTLLFLFNSLGVGGSELRFVRLANWLHAKGYKVHIGYLNPPDVLLGQVKENLETVCFEREGKFSMRAFWRVRDYVRDKHIDSIVCVNLYPVLYGFPAARLLTRRRTCIVSINTSEFLDRKKSAQMMLYARLLKLADKVVFGCRDQENTWQRRYRLQKEKSCHIYNGVDHEYYDNQCIVDASVKLRKHLGIQGPTVVIGSVGQLRPEKAHAHFIEAMAELRRRGRDVKGLLVGRGPEEPHLKIFAQSQGIGDHVIFLGELEDVRPAVSLMDVFVMTSIAVETFSNAALEAMSMAKPVILSDVGGATDMVVSGINGFIYPRGDINRLIELIDALVVDAGQRTKLGDQARRIVVERFTFDRMAKEYEGLLCNTIP